MRSAGFVVSVVFILLWIGTMKVSGEEPPVAVVEPALGVTEGTSHPTVPAGEPALGTVEGTSPQPSPEMPATETEARSPAEVVFDIQDYQVDGNTILPVDRIQEVLSVYRGSGKKLEDVENGRLDLEGAYHESGYPAVLVVVPEQTLENGMVRLMVIESKIGEVRVTGNRYFATGQILSKLPSLQPGSLLYEPAILKEMNRVNANTDLEAAPVLQLGQEPGTVDLELKVEDRIPLHGSLEWNNRGTPNTPRQRLNGSIQYANLFHREHSLAFQTTQTPDDFGSIEVYSLNYVMPLKREDHLLAFYGVLSESQSVLDGGSLPVIGGDIQVAGDVVVLGARYLFSIFEEEKQTIHQFALGLDYRDMDKSEAVFPGGLGTALVSNRIRYTPLSISYSGIRPSEQGITKVNALLKGYIAGMVPQGGEEEFGGDPDDPVGTPGNRQNASGTFAVLQVGLERNQNLTNGKRLTLKGEGQWANEPLISAEQYFAGGMESVRGYQENEASGDKALRGSIEWTVPLTETITTEILHGDLKGVIFYDAGVLWLRDTPAGQDNRHQMEGTGFGLRAKFPNGMEFAVDHAWALRQGPLTSDGDREVYFSVKWVF